MMTLTKSQWSFLIAEAHKLGVNYEATKKWRQRNSVPWRFRPMLAERARKAGISLPREFLMAVAA